MIEKLNINDGTVVDPQLIINGMNKFFSNVGQEMLKTIKNPKINYHSKKS